MYFQINPMISNYGETLRCYVFLITCSKVFSYIFCTEHWVTGNRLKTKFQIGQIS